MKNDLTCAVTRDLLPSYVEGLTAPETNQAVEAHLSTCSECAALREALASPTEEDPQAAREATFDTVPAGKKKSVLVVGGGVAGMEAARCAASRGHTVTLWEKSGQLGGNLIPAGAHDFKAELNELNAWYQTQLDTLWVAVQRNHPATAQAIQEAHPDAVVLAVGATPTVPPTPMPPL